MRNLLTYIKVGLVAAVLSVVAHATAYTITAPHYTMHVGDLVPPCIIQISNGTSIVSESNTLFSGAASCSIGATSVSPVGNYTITVSQGTLASLTGGDTISTVNSQLTVIAPDGEGASLTVAGTLPPGFFGGIRFPAINMTSNGIANVVAGGTDNAAAFLELTAFGRGTQLATVSVATSAGTSTITQTSGTQFTGLAAGTPIKVDGLINSIASVTDATHLVTTSTVEGGVTLTGVQLEFPPWVVNVSGTAVTAVSGPTFTGLTGQMLIDGTVYTISSVTDATDIVLTTSAPTLTNKNMYKGPASCCSAGSGGSTPQNFYLPAGVYSTSQPLQLYLNYWQIIGDGPQSSVIKLLPNSPMFNTGTATQWISPQSVGGNQNFHQFVYNLGFEIGAGNPNAIPLTTEMNNVAAMRNVQIWADDSVCPYAISERRGFPGPMLLKNIAIYGCNNAISSNQNEYTTVIEGLTLEGQTGVVMDPTSHNYALRHVLSDNPAIFFNGATGSYGVVSLLDSELLNGNSSTNAIGILSGGSGYFKNVHVTGYQHSIVDSSTGTTVTVDGNVTQSWSGPGASLFGGTPDSLHLPENETPIPTDPSPSTWTALDSTVANWPTEISSSASTTVYAPPGGYNTANGSTVTINVPDTVNHIIFYQSKRTDNNAYTIQLNVAGTSATPIVIDGCIYNQCNVVHTGSRTLVLLDSVLNQYSSAPGAGNLYGEDTILTGTAATVPLVFYSSQHIWFRHMNLEHHTFVKLDCEGCTIWVLGYKTEEPFPNIVLNVAAKGEFFTTFMYSNVLPSQPSQILLNNSSVFLSSVLDKVDTAGRGNTDWVTDTQNSIVQNLPTGNINNTINLPMYYSYGANVVPTPTGNNPRGRVLSFY
jgi:hypothetical protein